MYINLLATAWQTLFSEFDITTIIFILLLGFFASIEMIKGVEFFKKRRKKKTKEEQNQENRLVDLEAKETNNENVIQKVQYDITNIKRSVNLLVESDRDDIRAWMTEKYHYYMELGYIDDFTLDCMERRFKSYKQEGGNTYVDGMMDNIRQLPHKNNQEK